MAYPRCSETIIGLINEATEQFGELASLNKERYESLNDICDVIDNLIDETDCKSVEVDVDEKSGQVTITIICDEVVLGQGGCAGFCGMVQLLSSFSFSKEDDNSIRIALIIDDMWEWKNIG